MLEYSAYRLSSFRSRELGDVSVVLLLYSQSCALCCEAVGCGLPAWENSLPGGREGKRYGRGLLAFPCGIMCSSSSAAAAASRGGGGGGGGGGGSQR